MLKTTSNCHLFLSYSILFLNSFGLAEPKQLPNIVFILADDMSYDSVSAFNDQLGPMQTPFIDKLVAEGLSFQDGHSASSVCTPTRYGLLTGRYCWRTRLKKEVLWSYGQPLIKSSQLTIPKLLKKAGYTTAMIGKWHLGLSWKTKEGKLANGNLTDQDKTWAGAQHKIAAAEAAIDWSKEFDGGPCDHGFDHFFGVDLPNMGPYTWLEHKSVLLPPTMPKPKDMFGAPGLMVANWKLENILPKLREKAEKWITQAAQNDAPYFLFLSLTSPHSPIAPSKEFAGKSKLNPYVDFIIETDDFVGKIMQAINKTNKSENTLLIFSTDNGTAAACNFKELEKLGIKIRNNFKAHKASIFEGGHRVPLILKWPAVIKPKSLNNQVVSLNDFLATFAEMTRIKLREDEAVDSTSIWPLILGKTQTLSNRSAVINHSYRGQFAIRDQHWKLILPMKKNGESLLFNLKEDPKETKNLASKFPGRVKEMTQTLKKAIENGRSTPGKIQKNFEGKTHWNGLPW